MFLWPRAAQIILAFSIASLAFAYIMQYGFHYEPCELCLMQRIPFACAIVFSALAILKPTGRLRTICLALCGLSFLVGCGLAIFHTGVERHWWLGTSGCRITPLNSGSVSDLTSQLMHMAVARCDQISWTFLGLTMANYNIVYSFLLSVFSFAAFRKAKQ